MGKRRKGGGRVETENGFQVATSVEVPSRREEKNGKKRRKGVRGHG